MRVFELRTEPHPVRVGTTVLHFEPETYGADFVEAYNDLRDAQVRVSRKAAGRKASSSKHAQDPDLNVEDVKALNDTMRRFVRGFLVPESHAAFDGLKIPDRILLELIDYLAELYGGGSGNPVADGGQSSD